MNSDITKPVCLVPIGTELFRQCSKWNAATTIGAREAQKILKQSACQDAKSSSD